MHGCDDVLVRHRGLGTGCHTGLRRRLSSTTAELAVEEARQLHHSVTAQRVLGEEIGRIYLTGDLSQIHASRPDGLLDPEGMGVEVSEFTQTLAVADPYRCTGVCPDTNREFLA